MLLLLRLKTSRDQLEVSTHFFLGGFGDAKAI